MDIVAFVEGTTLASPSRAPDPFLKIWKEVLPQGLGLHSISRVVPISKVSLVVMYPNEPAKSSFDIPLDELILAQLRKRSFDVAVIIWNLLPPWNSKAQTCRWQETLNLYACLSQSTVLPDPWKEKAKVRYRELSQRSSPSIRNARRLLARGDVLAVCMEPTFESLLIVCEQVIRRTVAAKGKPIPGWPAWSITSSMRPEHIILQPAISSARHAKPDAPVFRAIRGDMITAKHEWALYFLKAMFADPKCEPKLKAHPFARRLVELLGELSD